VSAGPAVSFERERERVFTKTKRVGECLRGLDNENAKKDCERLIKLDKIWNASE